MVWMVSFIILSLASPHQATGSQVRMLSDWYSEIHCQDCANSIVSICSNGAASHRSGDLCGCCSSCVQIRDLGASCGSQLAVRSSPNNFRNSTSLFTVLATASCRHGLACLNFTCERSEDEVDRVGAAPVERNGDNTEAKSGSSDDDGSEESDDLRTNEINLPTTDREAILAIQCGRPKDGFDFSGHLINVVNAGREFQLIYGREPLADLKLLLKSIDKSQSTSILDEFEALRLYERFKDVLELANSDRKSSSLEEIIDPEDRHSTTVDSQDQLENENRRLAEPIRDQGGLAVLQKFTASRSSKLPRPRVPIRFPTKFRRKRQLEDSNDEDARSKSKEDPSRRWFVAGEVESTSEGGSPTALLLDPEVVESTINIHITGAPRMTKSASEFEPLKAERIRASGKVVAIGRDGDNDDDKLEIFLTDADTEFPNFSKVKESLWKSTNTTTSPISESYQHFESENDEIDNATEIDWGALTSMTNSSGYFSTNYEFTFPESPVVMEDDDSYQFALSINDTVEEFRAQLNRIETRVVMIESSLYDMLTKFGTNERSSGTGKENLGYTSKSDDFSHSELNATERHSDGRRILRSGEGNTLLRRFVLSPRIGGTNLPEENSTYVYLGSSHENTNGKSFRVEDEGIAQLVPIRSNRRWRTVTLQPRRVKARKIFESRGRLYPSWSQGDKVHEGVHPIPRRKKFMQPISDWRHQGLIARRFGTRKMSDKGPSRSTGTIMSPTFLSHIDARSLSIRSPGDHFSREQYGPGAAPSRSAQPVVWPLNPAWSNPLSTERTKRKSSEVIKGVPSRGANSKNEETSLVEESVAKLETQIPKPLVGAKEFKDFDNRMGLSSTGLATMPMSRSIRRSFDEEDYWKWNSWDDGPSLNLFMVNGESGSEFQGTGESPETLSISMENENPEILEDRWEVTYPSYLDYSENAPGDEEIEESTIAKGKATGSSMKLRRKRLIRAEGNERMKRSLNYFDEGGQARDTIISGSKSRLVDAQSMTQGKTLSGRRSKCSGHIADWLRAALGTWFASTEEITDTNLTNANLFTREIPIHLERYRPNSAAEDDSIPNSEASHIYPIEVEDLLDHPSLIPDDDELFRKKSAADFFQADLVGEAIISGLKNKSTDAQSTVQDRSSSGQRSKGNVKMADRLDGEAIISRSKNRSNNAQSIIQDRSPSEQRSKRSVQMADWLRAAEEYQERLQQVRTAALRTWLTSRDDLADTNLTNVKLFTREIPTYLERYRPSYTPEDDSHSNGEGSRVYPIEVEDPLNHPSFIPTDEDQLFTDFLHQTASVMNGSKAKKDDNSGKDPSSETSLSTARKFTIIATGNSTIRIEELPKSGDVIEESLFGDQSAQSSISREQSTDRRTALASIKSDDFDHMYDGVDAEDEDFDYGDSNFALSRWLDEIDIIDASSVEIPVDKAKSTNGDGLKDEEDYEVDELLSRSKRDAPLFLFRVNGDPGREVLVWPSNWKDFINRHFRRNRTGNSASRNSPRRATKRTRTRISKLRPARTKTSDTKVENSHEGEAEISASAERTSDEDAERDSSVELAFARRFQHTFDNRPRQNKRKNTYRSNIANY